MDKFEVVLKALASAQEDLAIAEELYAEQSDELENVYEELGKEEIKSSKLQEELASMNGFLAMKLQELEALKLVNEALTSTFVPPFEDTDEYDPRDNMGPGEEDLPF